MYPLPWSTPQVLPSSAGCFGPVAGNRSAPWGRINGPADVSCNYPLANHGNFSLGNFWETSPWWEVSPHFWSLLEVYIYIWPSYIYIYIIIIYIGQYTHNLVLSLAIFAAGPHEVPWNPQARTPSWWWSTPTNRRREYLHPYRVRQVMPLDGAIEAWWGQGV